MVIYRSLNDNDMELWTAAAFIGYHVHTKECAPGSKQGGDILVDILMRAQDLLAESAEDREMTTTMCRPFF